MPAELQSLAKIFNNRLFRIPDYQRGYAWGERQLTDFWSDLMRVGAERTHYCGQLTLEKAAEDRWRQWTDDTWLVEEADYDPQFVVDGQQRLTSLTAVLKGQQVSVRGRKKPIDILFNIDHPAGAPTEMIEVFTDEDSPVLELDIDEEGVEEGEDEGDELDLQERLKLRTFVVASKAMAQLPNWVSVSRVFSDDGDTEILKRAGIKSFDDSRYKRDRKSVV